MALILSWREWLGGTSSKTEGEVEVVQPLRQRERLSCDQMELHGEHFCICIILSFVHFLLLTLLLFPVNGSQPVIFTFYASNSPLKPGSGEK